MLLNNHPHNLDLELQDEQESGNELNILHISLVPEVEKTPTDLLVNDDWVKFVTGLFELEDLVANLEVNETIKSKADVVCQKLHERFEEYLLHRNIPRSKRRHWVLQLARRNLSVVAVVMVLSDHVKDDVSCLRLSDCLLSRNMNKILPTA